jgi:hypothetical protein
MTLPDSNPSKRLDDCEELRKKCEHRMAGLGEIVRRLRATGNPDDFADGAFLLGALSDISDYVGCLRGIE